METSDVAWRLASILGMLLLVLGYVLNHRGRWSPQSIPYLAANSLGGLVLAVYSWHIGEWVFVALEGFWSWVSAVPLARACLAGPSK